MNWRRRPTGMRTRLLLAGLVLATCIAIAQAQAGSQPAVAPDGVHLWNSNQIAGVYFAISGDTCTAVDDHLPPNASNTYRCRRAKAFRIVVSTRQTDGSVETKQYRLQVGRRYRLFYNLREGTWDVEPLGEGTAQDTEIDSACEAKAPSAHTRLRARRLGKDPRARDPLRLRGRRDFRRASPTTSSG